MKAILKSFFKKLLGLSPVNQIRNDSGDLATNVGVRLSRLPFFLVHVLAYAVLYFIVQLYIMSQSATGQAVSIGEFGFTALILIVTLLLTPIYVRRAHDLGWSFKYVFFWAILPACIRLLLLVIPLLALLNQELILSLFKIMPYIGFAYWVLGQIQILFTVILTFAPGTGTHNRYGPHVSRAFTMQNLYGFTLLKNSKKIDDSGEIDSKSVEKIIDTEATATKSESKSETLASETPHVHPHPHNHNQGGHHKHPHPHNHSNHKHRSK